MSVSIPTAVRGACSLLTGHYRSSSCWPPGVRAGSANWPPKSAFTSQRRFGCSAHSKHAISLSKPPNVANIDWGSDSSGSPGGSTSTSRSPSRPETLTEKLAHKVGESINVAVLRENYAVNVVQSRGQASIASHNWIGQLTPLHATSSGKVLLAYLDPAKRADLIGKGLERFTANTHTDPVLLESELNLVVERGHATTYGELEIGLNAVAVPVRSEDGTVVAALTASGPAYRFTPERIAEILDKIETAGAELSRRLGHWGNAA